MAPLDMRLRRHDGPGVPAALSVGLLLNAAFAGLVSAALPLWLAARGETKGGIAAFFLLGAVTAATLNLLVGRRARNGPRVVAGAAAVSAAGLAVLSYAPWSWTVFPAGIATMAMSVVYPQYMATAQHLAGAEAAVGVVARLRTRYTVGYIAGLGLFSAFAAAERYAPVLRPVNGALLLSLLGLGAALLWRPPAGPTAHAPAHREHEPEPAGRGSARVLVCTVTAIVLLRAADSLRGVYLPLYVLHSGWSQQLVSALFAVTVVVEVAVLRPLGRIGDRRRDGRLLTVVALVGGVSFLLVVLGGGRPLLVVSQVVYAAFTAGFQVVGMALLGRMVRTGATGGASLYTAAVQIGSAAGVLAPLAVPGYSSAVFLIAAGFCGVSCLLLVSAPDGAPRGGRRRPGPARDGVVGPPARAE